MPSRTPLTLLVLGLALGLVLGVVGVARAQGQAAKPAAVAASR